MASSRKQLYKKLCAGLVAVTLLNGCSLFGSDDVVEKSALPKVENQFKVQQRWSTSVGNGVGDVYSYLRPAYLNGVIYAADRDGTVKAMNADNGKQIWKVDLADRTGFLSSEAAMLSGGITADDGVLYLASEKAQLYALNANDGSVIWRVTVAGEVISRPTVSEGVVLVNTGNGMLHAVDQKTGETNWIINLDMPALSLRGESTPVVAHGAAIVGSNTGRVNAILLDHGQFIWQQRIAVAGGATEISRLSDVDSTPVIVDNQVYAAAYNGNFASIDLRSGQMIWQREIGTITDFVVEGEVIYAVDNTDRVLALDRHNGSMLWTQDQLLHRGLTAPTVYQNYVVVGDSDGYLHWMNTSDGQFVAQNKVSGSGLLSAPQTVNNSVMIQARNGTVYTFSN